MFNKNNIAIKSDFINNNIRLNLIII
jgi:hypothetical protein